METKLIEYVGKQVNRIDDVLRTARIWPKPGSYLEIPAAEAFHYLAHPMEWRETTREELALRADAGAEAEANLTRVLKLADKLPAQALRAAAARLVEAAVEKERAAAAKAGEEAKRIAAEAKAAEGRAEVTGEHPDTSGAPGSEYSEQRRAAIVKAAAEIDLRDPEKARQVAGSAGAAVVPTVEALLPYLTFRPTDAEIEEALLPTLSVAVPKPRTTAERAQDALDDLPAAERPVMLEMIKVFGLEVGNTGSLDQLRGRVRKALEALAAGEQPVEAKAAA